MAGNRNHYERAFTGWLAGHGIQALAVDERRRPVVESRLLKNFDFLVNGAQSVLALDLKGRRGTPWITGDDLFSAMAWRNLLAGRVQPAFLFAFFSPAGRFSARVEALPATTHGQDCGTYRFCLLWLDDAQRLARRRSASWGTYGFEWAAFARAVTPAAEALLPLYA
ncbi:MAG: HYExAFE family protein [Planctomycetes bacterium]|jgi:hypothetical protein|nr:HYExAFE family protein [Planctomycetota bacterium]MCL4731627.1 HYExAFE family protein [Planctomycetota bacterium]